ncbi:MAG: hypothetical protein JWQ71_4626 [Pedosphaera sp.]|nr:hypothetical protein [Pedosphaera sp.]
MNESEANIDSASGPSLKTLQEELQSLRTLVTGALAILFIFSVCLNIFLSRQAMVVSNQAAEAQKAVDEFRTFGAPWANDFWYKLLAYSKTHNDIAPIISKYSPYITASPPQATNNAVKKK